MNRILAILCLIALLSEASLRLEVQNGKFEKMQEVVSATLSPTQYAGVNGQTLLEITEDGRLQPVPFSISNSSDGGVEVTWLMPGLTRAEAKRVFVFKPGKPMDLKGGLSMLEDDDSYRISNQYFSLCHYKKGPGGQPQEIRFANSGNLEKGIAFYDRVHTKETGTFYTLYDANAIVSLVSSTPLSVVLEAKTGYCKSSGEAAPGNLKATYRYTYYAFSPRVKVEAFIEREDDALWRELHFLHPVHPKRVFDRFVIGNSPDTPLVKHDFLPPKSSERQDHSGSGWGVMENSSDAIGVSGKVCCWDASSQFVYYIRSMQKTTFPEKKASLTGHLYLGPASHSSNWYASWLSPAAFPTVTVLDDKNAEEKPQNLKATHLLEADGLRIGFAGADRGFAIQGIQSKDDSGPLFCDASTELSPLWLLSFAESPSSITKVFVDSTQAIGTMERQGNSIVFRWKDVPVKNSGTVDVTATVRIAGRRAEWTLEVANHSNVYGLFESEYPFLPPILESDTADVVLPTGNWGGKLCRNNRSGYNGNYPTTDCPLQMLAVLRNGHGFYFAAHDGGARPKSLILKGNQSASVRLLAENAGVPGSGQKALFPVVTELFEGEWWNAAKLYRTWVSTAPWTAMGLIRDNPNYPKGITDLGFWYLLSGPPATVEPTMDEAYNKRATVPHGVHWYNWHEIPFDNSYPEYFPTKEGVPEATQRMTDRGQVVMPYINGRLWDQDIPSFENAKPYAAMMPNGKYKIEIYASKRNLVPMCPYTELWQSKIQEVCHRLMDECHVNAIYLDQIGAARPIPCYNKEHGHPLGGGTHWVDGYRKMLSAIHKEAASKGVFLTTENTSEPYMDNIQGFLAWNERFETDLPLLPAVYSGYTTYFTSPQNKNDDLDAFRLMQGRDFTWGCQLGWNHAWIHDDAHRKMFDFSMDLAEHRLALKDFMVFGELIGDVKPLCDVPTMTVTWGYRKPHFATLPCIQGKLWKDKAGNLCQVIVNCSDKLQEFKYALPSLSEGRYLYSRVTGHGKAPLAVLDSTKTNWTLRLGPGEVYALVISPLEKGDEKKLSKQAQTFLIGKHDARLVSTAKEFLFNEAVPIDVFIPLCITKVRGEPLKLDYSIRNNGKATKLSVVCPDGVETIKTVPANEEVSFSKTLATSDVAKLKNYMEVSLPDKKLTKRIPISIAEKQPIELTVETPSQTFAGEEAMGTLFITNNTSSATDAAVLLQAPDQWTIEPSYHFSFTSLKPGERCIASFTFRPAQSQTQVNASIRAMLVTHGAQATITVQPERPRIVAKRAKGLVIDGKLDEWQAYPAITLGEHTPGQQHFTDKYDGNKDCSAKLQFAWDAQYLYIAAKIQDNHHNSPARDGSVWNGDCIQFALRRNGPASLNSSPDGINEFALAADVQGPFVHNWAGGQQSAEKELKVASILTDDGITYEAAIPWRYIGLPNATASMQYGLSFVVADNDGKGLHGWLEWTPGVFGSKAPSAYGWLTLE